MNIIKGGHPIISVLMMSTIKKDILIPILISDTGYLKNRISGPSLVERRSIMLLCYLLYRFHC